MANKREEYCKRVFHDYINQIKSNIEIKWKDLSAKNIDPPDFILDLGQNRYAVEQTQFKYKLKSESGEKFDELQYINSMEYFVNKVSNNAKKYLNGTYVITFLKPISNFSDKKQNLMKDMLNYIKKTKDKKQFRPKIFNINNCEVCRISKDNNKTNMVSSSFVGPFKYLESPEHLQEIYERFKEVILRKKEQLYNNCSERIKNLPKILLLLNSYPLADQILYNKMLKKHNLKNLEYYHTIFIVQDSDRGFFVYSKNENWLNYFNN